MKALVIYDLTGRIWSVSYGEDTAPQGLRCMFVDIPEGAQLERIDVTTPEAPEPVYTYLPDSDIGRLQKQVEALQAELAAARLESDTVVAELTMAMAGMMAAEGGEGNV